MRDYVSLVWRRAIAVMPEPTAVRALMLKHRAYSFMVAAVFLVALTGALIFAKNIVMASQSRSTVFDTSNNTVAGSTATTQTQQGETTVNTANQNTGSTGSHAAGSSSESNTSTNVTVNNQQIPVPENGSVSKTIQNSDGSTTVNVSSNNVSNGDSNSSSTTSTSLNVSTSTQSGSTKVNVSRSTSH
jgi:hypothetical protein